MNIQSLIPLALKASIVLIVFALGLRANMRDATYLFRRPSQLVPALLSMSVLMPVFAVALVLIFDLNLAVKIALVALSVSPIPPVLTKKAVKAGGTEPYTIGLLVAAGLLAIIWVPVAMELFEQVFRVRLQMTMASIAILVCITVLGPLALGIVVQSLAPTLAERLAKPISVVGTVVLLVGAVAVLLAAGPQILTLIGNGTILSLAAFVVAGLVMGHLLGGPDAENRTVLALSTASRHPGVAIAIAHSNFPQQKLSMAAVLLYLLISGIVSVPYLAWTKRQHQSVVNEVKA